MELVALTGGIAAGKSTVAARLSALGAVVIDADELAREAVAAGSAGLAAVVERFGPDILDSHGNLDRAALGAIVFAHDGARADLNAIVHPEVRRLYHAALDAARAADPQSIVIYDVPLLAEARSREEFDLVVVVDAPAPIRIARLIDRRGLSPEHATQRVEAQASDEERRALADIVIDASGEESATLAQTDDLWRTLVTRKSVGGDA